ncbi:MAG: hypothetical protein VR72_15480 [Clostridiaceae bacterium BRH_c20a]|nr:MAG: hypothetical protein VR72_15480 [Clostridiaceae bacterium BRH_c20a]
MLISIIIGFSLGLIVSIINHFLTTRAYKKFEAEPDTEHKKKLTNWFFIRQILIIVVLFLVYRDMWMLISAAVGLTMVKNYILLQYTLGKKGVS